MSQVYEETATFFRHLAKDNNVFIVITETEFLPEIDFNLYVFDVQYENRYFALHLVKVTVRVTAETKDSSYAGFPLHWKFHKISVSSDEQKTFRKDNVPERKLNFQ